MTSNTKAKVLCVDDEKGVLESISRLLKNDFDVLTALSAEKGIEAAMAHPDIAVVVSDYRMPGMNGIEFLKRMKQICPTAARTILSGQMDINELSHAINNAEIHRFFLKPWENSYLKLQIHEAVQTHVNLSEKVHFKHLAITDPVTSLTNHRFFQDELRTQLNLKSSVSLIMLDVDHFKSFNDRYGHPEGDRLLSQLGQILAGAVRNIGTASRYGGEEFAIILPELDLKLAKKLAEKIRETVGKTPLVGPGRQIHATISLGIAHFPSHAKNAEDLIQFADEALYEAKKLGRNQTHTFQPKSTL
jgi:diguanylate cyclase (GGDEF)-like protein